jgi:hypothetical protein
MKFTANTNELLEKILKATHDLSQRLDVLTEVLLEPRSQGKHVKGLGTHGYNEHEYTTGKYDWGLYVGERQEIVITAYALELDEYGDAKSIDTQCFVSLHLSTITVFLSEEHAQVAYLLKDTSWWKKDLLDYEDWVNEEFLTSPEAPEALQAFVKYLNSLSSEEFKNLARATG